MLIKKNKIILIKIALVFFLLIFTWSAGFFVKTETASAAAYDNFFNGLKTTGEEQGAGYNKLGRLSPMTYLAKMAGSSLTPIFMGVNGLLLYFYAGFTWMMARGNEQRIEKAKAILINTTIAMIVAFSAYGIVKLIEPLWLYTTAQTA